MPNKDYKLINRCRLCLKKKFKIVFDLGKTPLANSFLNKNQINNKEKLYPLKLNFCKNCFNLQLSHSVYAKKMFSKYLYLSNTSKQNWDHFKLYAKKLDKLFPKNTKKSILDIASNDGTFLNFFNKKDYYRLGVDPAKNLIKFSKKLGIKQLPIFFTKKNSQKIKEEFGSFDIITANHVCAHVSDLNDFFLGVKNLLKKKGIFVFEVSYLGSVIKKKTFDTIYHEHADYHSLKPLLNFVKKFNMEIFDYNLVNAQGGSIRIYVCHKKIMLIKTKKINKLISLEKNKLKLYKISTFLNFKLEVNIIKVKLLKLLKKIKKDNKIIAGYGAAAKTTTLMSYFGIDKSIIDFIIDDNKLKQNKYTPSTHIPIFSAKKISLLKPDYILVLAWNYAKHIIDNRNFKFNGKFIIPFPKIKIMK